MKILDEEVIAEISRLRSLGLNSNSIGYRLHISHCTIGKYLNPEYQKRRIEAARRFRLDPEGSERHRELMRSRQSDSLHKELRKERRRYNQVHVTINGVRVKVKVRKRPWTGYCEVCGKVSERLHWHHWNQEKPGWGIWACPSCHYFVEAIDRGLNENNIKAYLSFKTKIESNGGGEPYE